VDLYSTDLGYGWTHNLDSRLIFPDDPGGEDGYVFFKERTANLYKFVILGANTFSPVPGIQGSLSLTGGQYELTLPTQSKYTFDTDGQLQTWQDAQGRRWEYEYDSSGRLEEVGADGGVRFLTIVYNGQGQIASVSDHAGRSVIYTYNQ
jgi:YD repeat-containing protein